MASERAVAAAGEDLAAGRANKVALKEMPIWEWMLPARASAADLTLGLEWAAAVKRYAERALRPAPEKERAPEDWE